jgi:outer membrane protein assembly factor BamB
LSDKQHRKPAQPSDKNQRGETWEQDPFMPYDGPFINPEGTGAPLSEDKRRDPFQLGGDDFEPNAEESSFIPPLPVSKPAAPPAEDAQSAPRRGGRVARLHENPALPPPDTQPARRQADPADRFAGARTAMPQDVGGAVRPPVNPYRPPVRSDAPPKPRPQQVSPVLQKPPVTRRKDDAYGWPEPSEQPPMREPYDNRRPPRRSGKGLLILLIILIILGGAFAGIWLPNWDSVEGTIGETMSSVQTALKNLIMPEEIVIRAFSVQPNTGVAPVELSFVIYASTATETVRVIDDAGKTILEKTIDDQDRLLGTVTKNSDGNNIWKLRYNFETAYSGNLTAQAMGKDGEWNVAGGIGQAVSIEPPMVFDPPIQDFLCSTVSDIVPVTVSFSVVTSLDVSAVRIVNDYGDEIARLTVDTAGINMTETGETRVWTLEGAFDEPYAGTLYVGYELIVGEGFTQSDYKEDVVYAPAAIPEDTLPPDETAAPTEYTQPTLTPSVTPTPEPTVEPTATPTPEPTPEPTLEPTPTEEPAPTPTPSPTLMPLLPVLADSSEGSEIVTLKTAIYDGTSKTSEYSRTELINLLDSEKYAIWDQSGVLTFRGGPFRQNAAYGTVEMDKEKLSVLWKVPVEGTLKMNGATLTGVGWPGQAVIVKWPMEVRQLLSISTEMKSTAALKEVIVGAQNGKLYFLDLATGGFTRDPIEIRWPSNGAVSVNTDGSPIVTFGQYYSVKADKTKIDNGLHILNLLNNKELTLLNGRTKPIQTNYSGFSGAPLFDKISGAMIVGGQNGVFYLGDFNTEFDYVAGTLSITPKYHRYTWTAPGQKAKDTNIDGSVAMYGPYAYFGDSKGVLQCVDVNTLKSVWAVRAGDRISGTPALDMSVTGDSLSLYVGSLVSSKGGVVSFFRYDALSGKKLWQFDLADLGYTTSDLTGFYASPVVGQYNASGTVFATVTNGAANSTLYALSKADGSVQWSVAFTAAALSSPVAVYNEAGDAWIVQALSDGKLLLIDAVDGSVLNTLQLEGTVAASPAVYRNVLVISTMGQDPSYIYGIALE